MVIPPDTVYPRRDDDPRTGASCSDVRRFIASEIVGHALEHDHRVDVAYPNAFRYLNDDWGIVEDAMHPCGNQPVGDRLGVAGWDGDDRECDTSRTNNSRDLIIVQDGHAVDARADLVRITVEEGGDSDALAVELFVPRDRIAEVADPNQRHTPLLGQPKDALDLVE